MKWQFFFLNIWFCVKIKIRILTAIFSFNIKILWIFPILTEHFISFNISFNHFSKWASKNWMKNRYLKWSWPHSNFAQKWFWTPCIFFLLLRQWDVHMTLGKNYSPVVLHKFFPVSITTVEYLLLFYFYL